MRIQSTAELLDLLRQYEPCPTDYFIHGANRIAASINMIPEGRGKVLELGCDSHFTLAASLLTDYEITPQNSPNPIAAPENVDDPTIRFENADNSQVQFTRTIFDVEADAFPFPDESFDGVLCCELIEHLFHDPAHMLHEANRVLRPGGWLLLTTPNATAFHMIRKAAMGIHPMEHSLYFAGQYGRVPIQHTREYTFWEIVELLACCGLSAESKKTFVFTQGEKLSVWDYLVLLPALTAYGICRARHPKHLLPRYRKPHTFVLARKTGAPTKRYPAGIYLQ